MPSFRTLFNAMLVALLSLVAFGAHALDVLPYSAQALTAAQQAGRPVALHFHADWCPTCRAQAQVLERLKADKSLDLTVLVADYDKEKALKKQYGVRFQSTLIVFRGVKETARLGGETGEARIRAALSSAL